MANLIKHKNTWYARWTQNGKRMEKTTGVKVDGDLPAAKLKKLAQTTADAMQAAACGSAHLSAALAAVQSVATTLGLGGVQRVLVKDFFDAYSPSGGVQNANNSRRAVARFLAFSPSISCMFLDAVTPSLCRDFLRAESGRVSVGTLRTYRSHLSAAFNRAVRDELIARNPFASLRAAEYMPKGEQPQKRLPFTPEELAYMIHHFPSPWCDLVLVSFLTGGQRLGDCVLLEWGAVDFAAGVVRFRTRKTGAEIVAPMVHALRARLEALRSGVVAVDASSYVFPSLAGRYLRSNGVLSIEFTAMLRAAGIVTQGASGVGNGRESRRSVSSKSFHSIRHSVVTLLRSSGAVTADVARAIVGHDSEEVERQYFTAPQDVKLRGLSLLADAIK